CTSSTTTTLYLVNHGSLNISCSSIPSVRYLIRVDGDTDVSKRTEYPTLLAGDELPNGVPISSATLLANDTAATRRGCVTAMHPPTVIFFPVSASLVFRG